MRRVLIGLIILLIGLSNSYTSVEALELIISGNGEESQSVVDAQVEQTTTVIQTNGADMTNDVTTDANTGANEASDNTGNQVDIKTGDVDTNLEIENSANSSVVDVGCCPEETSVAVSDNGSGSANEIVLDDTSGTEIVIEQNAQVSNNVQGSANTGENIANDNNGDLNIDTGDIKANSKVLSSDINTYSVGGASGNGDLFVGIKGNGSDSVNIIKSAFSNFSNINIYNNADIDNQISWDLNTGGNVANGNLGGVSIVTGDILFNLLAENIGINSGGFGWRCCDFSPDEKGDGDPGDPGGPGIGGPSDPGGPENGGFDDTENQGDFGDNAGKSSVSGSLLSEAASIGPSIIGLSDTSSEGAKSLLFWVGILMMAYGFKVIVSDKLPAINGKKA